MIDTDIARHVASNFGGLSRTFSFFTNRDNIVTQMDLPFPRNLQTVPRAVGGSVSMGEIQSCTCGEPKLVTQAF
eukprot:scaffold8837_cov54-Attheya_sp.AAC.1